MPYLGQNNTSTFDPIHECKDEMKIVLQTVLVDTEEIVLLYFIKVDIML